MSEESLKVTDRRMFNADGQLRDEFSHVKATEPQPGAVPEPTAAAEPAPAPEPEEQVARVPEIPPLREVPGYPAPSASQGPRFLDLIGLLAEPASLYLKEAQGAQSGELRAVSQAAQNLELARLHIDLLVVLREKSAAQLDLQERAMLDDVIYRLRMTYVQIQG